MLVKYTHWVSIPDRTGLPSGSCTTMRLTPHTRIVPFPTSPRCIPYDLCIARSGVLVPVKPHVHRQCDPDGEEIERRVGGS